METMKGLCYDSPMGKIYLLESDDALVYVGFAPPVGFETGKSTPLLERVCALLGAYFRGGRPDFSRLPLRMDGTPFQQEVWKALQAIPYGETRTYGQIASTIGRPKAVRAVGGACGRNPLPIVVPCHRVVGADGSLTGFSCGLDRKRFLLSLERETAEE